MDTREDATGRIAGGSSVLVLLGFMFLLATPLAADEAATGDGDALDLMSLYQLAADADPAIHRARARLDQAREATPQARARLLPEVSLSAQIQESWEDGTQIGFDQATGEIDTLDFETELDSTSYGVELRQTLFQWDLFIGLDRARAEVAEAEANFEGELQDLLIRVAEAYFNKLVASEVLATRVATREAFEREKERAEYGREVGLAALTDVEEARAAHDRALSDEIGAQRELEIAREALFELTGREIRELAPLRAEIELLLPEPDDIEFWVERARELNPELAAAEHVAEASEAMVSQARSGHYPRLELTASRRYQDIDSDNPFQVRDTVTDQIGVQLSMPLFRGGGTRSEVREARAGEREAWQAVKQANREVRRATRDAFLGIRSGVARVRALEQAVKSAETAVEATEIGVEVGTRSTLDLLNVRRELADARAEYAQVRFEFLADRLRLRRAVGELSTDYLERLNELFRDA